MQRRFILKAAAVLGAASLIGFGTSSLAFADESIKVGVTGGPHAQIMDVVKTVAAKNGLNIKVIEFSDYVQPNAALAGGDLDANSYQHDPYLQAQVKDRGYKLIRIADTVTYPMGIYSKKVKTWDEVKLGATLAIPNDPTNGGRVLILLRDKGIIKLKDGVGFKLTLLDITANPKKLKITEVDAAQLPRTLPDVDVAGINTNYATQAGLDPVKDAILREDPKGPYANIIAVRAVDKDKPWVKTLVESYQSPEVKAFIDEKFKGSVLATW